jgi:hypothetical protein
LRRQAERFRDAVKPQASVLHRAGLALRVRAREAKTDVPFVYYEAA